MNNIEKQKHLNELKKEMERLCMYREHYADSRNMPAFYDADHKIKILASKIMWLEDN